MQIYLSTSSFIFNRSTYVSCVVDRSYSFALFVKICFFLLSPLSSLIGQQWIYPCKLVSYPPLSVSGIISSSPTQFPTYFPHLIQDFWNLHLVVFIPLFVLRIPLPNSAFQQLRQILPRLIPSFHMGFYQVIFSIRAMHLHHNLLLLHPLLILNGVFAISPPSNIVCCLMYLWRLEKVG